MIHAGGGAKGGGGTTKASCREMWIYGSDESVNVQLP